ncbi:MAG: lysozyme [Rubrivivax sp.]|nr:lysozyme [Rubrivivax sp.]
MPAPLRDVPQAAIDLIKSFEGIPDGDPNTVNIDAYLCPAGVWTIGWGHALMDGGAQLKGAANKARARALYPGGITRAQAEALLAGDLIPRAASVSSLLKVPVDEGQFGALIALVFNIGAGNLQASTLLRKLNAGDVAGAAEQFLAWDKARVDGVLKPLAGLTRRRRAERAMFLGEDWRAAAAPAGVSRSRAAPLEVLPVPEAPEPEPVPRAKKPAPKKPAAKEPAAKKAAKKPLAKKPAATKAAAKKAAAKKTPVARA